jgi:hypothetical protein
MLSSSDARSFETADDRLGSCLFCGRALVLLPEDRRRGSCFDCLALSVPEPVACPDCGVMIPGDERGVGCENCGWYPVRD